MNSSRTTRRRFLQTLSVGAAALALPSCARFAATPEKKRKPNILLFMVDDMGWIDSAVYGSKFYETPNIDRLAKQGMLFTDAYAAAPLCSPTRASILTGKYPARMRMTAAITYNKKKEIDDPKVPLKSGATRAICVAENLTHMRLEEFTIAEALQEAGYTTAHVGKWHLGKETWWPDKQGFDVNIAGAHNPGPPSYFSPYKIETLEDGPEGEYIADRITDEALRFLEANRDRPFLLNFWHFSVHGPWGAKEEKKQKYLDKIAANPDDPQKCPTMGSMIESVDESIGRVLDKLDELDLADNTVLIFFSDNGGNDHSKMDGVPVTSNLPLRKGKSSIYEGGVREPMIVRWPGVVKAGTRCSVPVNSIDFYPTFLEIAGLEPKPDKILDGESLIPIFGGAGAESLKREALFWHFPHSNNSGDAGSSIRKGDYKFLRFYGLGKTNKENRLELYNLADDIGEQNNLVDEMPKRAKEMEALLDAHLKEVDALIPIPNPNYRPPGSEKRTKDTAAGEPWTGEDQCSVSVKNGTLRVELERGEGRIISAPFTMRGSGLIRMRYRSTADGKGRLFWAVAGDEDLFVPKRKTNISLKHDGKWRYASFSFPSKGEVTQLRINPAGGGESGAGLVEFDWIRLIQGDNTIAVEWTFD